MEEWKEIEGFEGVYQVSNMGRVKSLARFKRKVDKILTGSPNTTGYVVVQLYKDKKRYSKLVHRLVMCAFQPVDESEDLEVNHRDLDIKNNCLSNLEWVTTLENSVHYWNTADLDKRKETPRGESHHLAVMTADKVKELRRLYEENIITNKSELGRMFGIRDTTVTQILKRESWKDI